jgi:hypothetical protein
MSNIARRDAFYGTWVDFKVEKPKVGEVIYLLTDNQLEIAIVGFKPDEISSYEIFDCYECGFYGHPLPSSRRDGKVQWSLANRHKLREVCGFCHLEKWIHACGRDDHAGCAKYISAQNAQLIEEKAVKDTRGSFVFYWAFAIATILILVLTFGGCSWLKMYSYKYLYQNVAKPAIHDVSSEISNVTRTFKETETIGSLKKALHNQVKQSLRDIASDFTLSVLGENDEELEEASARVACDRQKTAG